MRLSLLFIAVITVVAVGMAMKGWQMASFLLASVLVLASILLLIEINRVIYTLYRRWRGANLINRQAERHYIDVLRRVAHVAESRHRYFVGRSERIGNLCHDISRKLGLSPYQCQQLRLAGELHDIGLLAVPENILNKNTRLGADEFREVQRHSLAGFKMLRPLKSLEDVLPAILYHHERMNGTGYPRKLKGDQIPLGARILAVAEAFDAITHDRPYRPAIDTPRALEELRRCTPDGFDSDCVDALAVVLGFSPSDETPAETVEAAVKESRVVVHA